MTASTGQTSKRATAVPDGAGRDRALLVERFLELRPLIQKRFSVGLEHELREELHHVTVHQLTVLGRLRHHSLTMRELAAELGVGESAATAVSDRLVRQGLVERMSDPHDRRIVRLELSKSGANLVERLQESAGRKVAAMLEVLSDTQLAWFVDILETLTSSLVGQPHSCGGACATQESYVTTTDAGATS